MDGFVQKQGWQVSYRQGDEVAIFYAGGLK